MVKSDFRLTSKRLYTHRKNKQTKIISLRKKDCWKFIFQDMGNRYWVANWTSERCFSPFKGSSSCHHLLTDKINNEHLRKPFFGFIWNDSYDWIDCKARWFIELTFGFWCKVIGIRIHVVLLQFMINWNNHTLSLRLLSASILSFLRHPNHFVLAGANNRNVNITYRFLAAPVQANRDFFWRTDCIFQL